jgi:hypothetical protein
MAKNQAQRALINIECKVAKPFVDAIALGLAIAGPLSFSGNFLGGFVCGSSFSLVLYWGKNNLMRPKRAKAKRGGAGPAHLIVNSATGSRKIRRFEYAAFQPGHINRETWGEMLRRWVGGERGPRPVIDKPHVPREFVFQSHYDGQTVELREDDVRRFLRAAWKNRQRGRGLSHRRWVREWRQRPQWYKDLGPYWYRALLVLLREAQLVLRCQLVVCIGPNWYALARDPHVTMAILREAEVLKGNVRQTPAGADALVIGTGGGE